MATSAEHQIKWVIPVDTEPEIDWDCPCLDGVACKPEVKAWYSCDREARRKPPGSRDVDCSTLASIMSECVTREMGPGAAEADGSGDAEPEQTTTSE